MLRPLPFRSTTTTQHSLHRRWCCCKPTARCNKSRALYTYWRSSISVVSSASVTAFGKLILQNQQHWSVCVADYAGRKLSHSYQSAACHKRKSNFLLLEFADKIFIFVLFRTDVFAIIRNWSQFRFIIILRFHFYLGFGKMAKFNIWGNPKKLILMQNFDFTVVLNFIESIS